MRVPFRTALGGVLTLALVWGSAPAGAAPQNPPGDSVHRSIAPEAGLPAHSDPALPPPGDPHTDAEAPPRDIDPQDPTGEGPSGVAPEEASPEGENPVTPAPEPVESGAGETGDPHGSAPYQGAAADPPGARTDDAPGVERPDSEAVPAPSAPNAVVDALTEAPESVPLAGTLVVVAAEAPLVPQGLEEAGDGGSAPASAEPAGIAEPERVLLATEAGPVVGLDPESVGAVETGQRFSGKRSSIPARRRRWKRRSWRRGRCRRPN